MNEKEILAEITKLEQQKREQVEILMNTQILVHKLQGAIEFLQIKLRELPKFEQNKPKEQEVKEVPRIP